MGRGGLPAPWGWSGTPQTRDNKQRYCASHNESAMQGAMFFSQCSARACPSVVLEGWRRVDPQHPSFVLTWIFPAVRRSTFKIKAVSGLQPVFLFLELNLQLSTEHVKKFLAFVRVRLTAAGIGRDPKKVRLHDRITPGKQFHAHSGPGLQHFTVVGAYDAAIRFCRIKKIQDVRLVKPCQFAQRADRGTHVRPLQRAEEPYGNSYVLGNLGQGKSSLDAQLAQVQTDGGAGSVTRRLYPAILLEHLQDSGRVQSADPTQEAGALEQFYVLGGVKPVLAFGAPWSSEPEALPGADHGRRHAHHSRYVADFQVSFGAACHGSGNTDFWRLLPKSGEPFSA